MEPITRKELFMAKAAGENVNVPEPITREEKYLKYMADNSASKYFVEQTETLLDKEYDIDNSSTKRDPLAVTVGDNVRVTFDGAEYNCTVLSLGNYLSIGNEAFWVSGGKDTGEPFGIHVGFSGTTYIMVHSSNVGTHSVKVEKILGETIDPKFIPAGVGGGVVIVQDSAMASGVMPAAQAAPTATMNAAQIAEAVLSGKNVYFIEPNNQVLLPFACGYRFGEMASGVMTAASSPDPFALFGSADEEGWYVGVKVVLDGAYYTFDYGIKTE